MTDQISGKMSRRAVLGGGVALGAAAALGKAPSAAAQVAQPITGQVPSTATQVTQPITGPALVGATFDLYPFGYGDVTGTVAEWKAAVTEWNSTTGTSMTCWKVYYQLSEFPTSIEPQIQTIIDLGIQALISFKPAIGPAGGPGGTPADRKSLASAVKMFADAGLLAEVCLWQEVGPGDMTAAQYVQYVEYYGPTIRNYYPLVFDAPGYQGPAEWQAYDPGHANLDGYAVDFYCGDYINHGVRLDTLLTLAGDLPVGIWEIGNTASASFTPTPDDVTDYMGYIQSTLSGRLNSGLPVGSSTWYNGPADASQTGGNEIAGTDPCSLAATDILQYQILWDGVNGVSPY
jgi:hypothetical protein